MQKTSLFDDGRVSVSSTRFLADGKTHLISDITSVRLKHTPARRGIADFLFFIGIGQLFTPFSSILPPLLCFLTGFIAWIVAKPKYIVVLTNDSREVNALTRSDQESIEKIIDALNEALSLK